MITIVPNTNTKRASEEKESEQGRPKVQAKENEEEDTMEEL